MGLEEAIERARLLYERVQDHLVPLQSIAVEWETNTKSSVFMQTISALKQFGLLEDEGKGEERQAKISSLAKTIINHQDSSRERDSALKIAALFPKIHQEIWLKYKGGLPPADSPIRAYLLERKEGAFNKDYVDNFIRQLRQTIAFAKLTETDKILPADENLEGVQNMEKPNNPPPLPLKPMLPTDGGPFISFPLPGGNVIEIRLRQKLSPNDFATVQKLVELSKDSLVDLPKE